MSQTVINVQLIFLLLVSALHSGSAMRLYKSRAEVLAFLGGSEGRLYFSECEQQTNTATCVYAMDSSLSRDHSQCAQSLLQEAPFWLGILELPAYITTVTILNMDQWLMSFTDGLLKLKILVDGDDCFPMETKISFDKRTFPCDAIGETVTIRSTATDPVIMSICDVEVVGVPLKFLTMTMDDQMLRPAKCYMSTLVSGNCPDIYDNVTTTCTTVRASSPDNLSYFAIILEVPSIINEVHVYTTSIEQLQVEVQGQQCTRRSSTNKFHCKFFGDTIYLTLHGAANANVQLSVCEVSVFGHESDLREPAKYTYLGCFREVPEDRDLPQAVSGTKLTVDKCYKICKRYGFKYFGLYDMRFCYCGFTYGKHGKLEETFGCEAPCDGDGRPLCGRGGAISEYEIL